MNRRKFLKRTFWGTVGVGFVSGIYAWQIEPFWLEIVKHKMPLKNLPDHLVGKTVMQMSDMHVGNRFDYQFLIESMQKAQKLNPDFVVYTGDYVSYETNQQIEQLHVVLKHAVLGKSGTFGILGNHDYGKNWAEQEVADKITMQLEMAGIHVLSNKSVEVNGLTFLGFDDYWGLNFGPEELMQNHDPRKPTIALCHNPDVCDLDVWHGYKSWILSGHTHGGQVKAPFLDPFVLPVKNERYTSGEIDLKDGRTLYINRALGHLWQVRFNVRPEITVFELEKG
jgi:predicted MPP superfamily phosphohydrolase